MKKFNRWFAVTLVICMLLSVSAYAVGTDRTPLCGKPGIEQPELPEKPDCELPELPELPEKPDCELPELPELPEKPDCELPELPELPEKPDCELPELPELPEIELPDVDFDPSECVVTHIDVKVDSTYSAVIDGEPVTLQGQLDPDTISIVVKTPVRDIVYDFADYDVETQEERGMLEYRINLKAPDAFLLAAIRWYGWHMGNVYFNADILLDAEDVPDVLKDSMTLNEAGQYVASVADHRYTGIQECTGGHGMRSQGHFGIPNGLDLYLAGADLCPYITTDDLTIEKVLVDSEGNPVEPGEDAPVFTFIMKDADGNYVYFVDGTRADAEDVGASEEIQVRAGESVTLKGITKGAYQIIELDTEGYKIYSIEGAVSESTGIAVLVGAEDDVFTFANMKVESTDPNPDPDPDPDPKPDPDPDPDPKPDPDPDPDPKPDPDPDPDPKPSNPGGGITITVPVDPETEPETPTEETTPDPVTPAPVSDDAPKTGDSGSAVLMMLMGISACGMGAALVLGRKFRYTGKRCK